MSYRKFTKKVLFISSTLFLVFFNCGREDEGKMPVTTSSEKALESYLQGRALGEKLQGQESLKHFQKAIAEDPDFALAYLNLSFAQPSAKGFFAFLSEAKAHVDKVSEGERSWILGFEAGVNGFPMKQREHYQKLVELYPNDERAHNILATHYFGIQEYEKAINEYNKAIEINPNFSPAYNQMGYAYRTLENFTAAENAFKKYIELIPDDPNPYDSYAELLMKVGRYDESIENYKKALAINPQFVFSFVGIATNLNLKGEYSAARENLQKMYGIARNDGERRTAHFARAVSYVFEGKIDNAVDEIKKQYELAEKINDAAAMSGDEIALGNLFYEAGQFDVAMKHYDKSLELIQNSDLSQDIKDNTYSGHLYNSARVALKQDNVSTAKVHAEEYKKRAEARNNAFQIRLAHELAGMIALEEKNFELAQQEFKQANQQNPYNLYRMALACQGSGDSENAKMYCEKAAKFNALNNMNYAFIKNTAENMLASL